MVGVLVRTNSGSAQSRRDYLWFRNRCSFSIIATTFHDSRNIFLNNYSYEAHLYVRK